MRSVMFNFHPEVSITQQDEALERINAWSSVSVASRLKPDAKNPLLQRMAYARVKDDTDIEKIVERLKQMPEVESASVPASRRLVRR